VNSLLKWLLTGVALLLIVAVSALHFVVPGIVEDGTNVNLPHDDYVIRPEVQKLHDSLFIADLHSDSLLWKRDLLQESEIGHMDLPRLQRGNVALQVFSATTKSPEGQNYRQNTGDSDRITWLAMGMFWPMRTWNSIYERAVYQLEKLHAFAERSDGELVVIQYREELEAFLARRDAGENVTGALYLIEGAHPLEGSVDNLDKLAAQGLAISGFTHFFDNELGGSLHGTSKAGLSEFGQAALQRMDELGIIIDIAHASPQMVADILDATDRPVILSHGGVKGVCDQGRNLDDALMSRVASEGGLIGIGYWEGAVCDPSPAGIVKSIRYAIDLLGVDHVALGSDYDGATAVFIDTSELAILTQTMIDTGFTEHEIRQVMGENVRRFLRNRLPLKQPKQTVTDIAAAHQAALVLDAHADVEIPGKESRYVGADGRSQVAPDKMRAGDVDAVVMAVAVGPGPRDEAGHAAAKARADEELNAILTMTADPDDDLVLARNADELAAAHAAGNLALILGLQNARIFGSDLSNIDQYYEAGVRVFALTHMGHNDYADSSRPIFIAELGQHEPSEEHGGLSQLGQEAVARINELGGIIDVSQLSRAATLEVVSRSSAPVIASHSNVQRLSDVSRNLSDEEIDAIARGGGVIHVAPFRGYLFDSSNQALDAAIRTVRREAGLKEDYLYPFELYWELDDPTVQQRFLTGVSDLLGPGSVNAMLDHIDYIVARVGIDHVGIGTDFNHGSGIEGFKDASEAMNVTQGLAERGYTAEEISKIWGDNFLRVFKEVDRDD